ncbi:MAG TPA: glycosyltransferase family 39 protein [Blastocatellia bacterium]|nr:glycosyltransferase family 39 protein [Blastocatellia bacterium]
MLTRHKLLRSNFDLVIVALIVAAFVFVASRRLGDVPVPETDESYTLQVAYAMVNRGQLSLPMYRYLGGNIENVWHSYTPVYFAALGGFFEIFGWGLAQGRAFNLITAALTLLMAHLIARRLFGWRAGLIAVVMLVSDQTFFERARLLRNDYAAASLGMLAYYLYEVAEDRKSGRYFIASGVAAGAAVMCHTNMLYMLGAILALMLFRRGWRVVAGKSLYQYSLAALAVMAYEIIYDIVDYKNFVLQNRDDRLHFGIFERWGWWANFLGEGKRYLKWYAGGGMFMNVPRATLHVFQLLAVAAIIYLIAYSALTLKRRDAMSKPAVRVFTVTALAALFHAFITSHKDIYYMAHLAPWFALCVGVMLNDAYGLMARLPGLRWPRARLLHKFAVAALALAVVAFGLQLARQNRRYLREVRNPDLASFEEIKGVLRGIVPDGVCPVAMKAPVLWLAFPEYDYCFATIEKRMMKNVDIDGKEYAVMMPSAYHKNRLPGTRELDAKYHLLGELKDTPYGAIRVYYTGANPDYLARQPEIYYFFGQHRGHVSQEQVAQAREVWSGGPSAVGDQGAGPGVLADAEGFSIQAKGRGGKLIDLWSVDLKPETVYRLSFDASTKAGKWELALLDERTGGAIHREQVRDQLDSQRIEGLFKTSREDRVRLVAQPLTRNAGEPLRISRITISEIPSG